MSTQESVIIVASDLARDPLIEEVVSAEGYQLRHAESLADVLANNRWDGASAVLLFLTDSPNSQINALLSEAVERHPDVKFMVSLPKTARLPPGLEKAGDRILTLNSDSDVVDNVAAIRRFLRGEGYQWASDLGALDDVSLLETSGFAGSEERRRAISRFALDLARHTEIRPLLKEALERYLEILRCGAGSMYLYDEASGTLVLEAALGPEADKRIGIRQKLGEGLAGWVAEVGEPILVTDSRKVQKIKGRKCKRYDNFSCLASPVSHGGQLFGVVCLTMPRDNKPFQPADLHLAQALSQKLASIIRPMNIVTELRRFGERLLGAVRSSTDLVLEKDSQMDALRVLSNNILESIPMAVIAYDRDLRLRSANRAARELFSMNGEPADRKPAPLEQDLDMNPEIWRRKLRSVVQDDKGFRLSRIGHRSKTGHRTLDVHCSPLQDSRGQTIGGLLTVQDVTEDAEMEAKLSSAERLALIGKLAAKVAHELNNPLDGILRFMNLAMRKLDEPEQARTYLEESRNGLLRMGNILSELLVFSRSHHAAHRAATLTQLIHQGLISYEERARQANIRINLRVPADLPPCPTNDIWEVFSNVVKNSLDAMVENGELTIEAERNGRMARIMISDTGPGVPEEVREKIFEPFFTTKKTGTGLGLAVCRDLLRRLGGDIRLMPSERGAAFEITVPIRESVE